MTFDIYIVQTHRVAQHPHTPYKIVIQAVNRLEDAGYVCYDDGLSVIKDSVRDTAGELVTTTASSISTPLRAI